MIALLACAEPAASDTAEPTGIVDGRIDFPEPVEGEVQLRGAEVVLEPGQDVMWCEFGTWPFGEQAVHHFEWFQNPDYGHHFMLMATDLPVEEHPDGSMIDCSDQRAVPAWDMRPLVQGTELVADAWGAMNLPEGVAVHVAEEQRYILQEHWVNATDEAVLVQNGMNLGFIEMSELRAWAAPFEHDRSWFELQPGVASTEYIDCTWEQDYTLISLMGHMHEYGTSLSIDWRHGAELDRIYTIDDWRPEYRDAPVLETYADGAFTVAAGDAFVTTCNWFNSTEETLVFPEEMCDAVGMLYPAEEVVRCQDERP